MNLCVIGLGKLGAPLAAVLASNGHTVKGVDRNAQFVDAINSGRAPLPEPRLDDQIEQAGKNLRATTDLQAAIRDAEVSFLVLPTPSDATGEFSNRFLIDALGSIGRELHDRDGYHLVVVNSTVMPGSMNGEIRAALELHSGRTLGDSLGLCYSPEFIAIGDVVNGLLRPDFVLIGESDTRAGEKLAALYGDLCENEPTVHRMNLVNAELTKIAVNSYVTTKISFANTLAEICENLPDADVDIVTAAVGADARIGSKYLKGAIGYGGPCFPRDNAAFRKVAESSGARSDLASANDAVNRHQIDRLMEIVSSRAQSGARIAILGMSYRPNTPVIEESQAVMLAARLAKSDYEVAVYDPMAMDAAMSVLGDNVTYAESAARCVEDADVIVVATAWDELARFLPPATIGRRRRPVVIDCWRVLPHEWRDCSDVVLPGRYEAPRFVDGSTDANLHRPGRISD